jgi:CheY-like chemotaxis protein
LAESSARGETILVVEDDRDIRRVVARVLSGLGHEVLEAGDGKTALALLERAPEVDLLLSDVVLPGGLSGPDIVAGARCQGPDLKSLFLSGHVAKGMSDPVRLADDIDLLRKPVTKHDLAPRVRAVLDQ